MKPTPSRSGFVYAALHPQHDNWVKIGFTRLTPVSRLKSLSGTSVRGAFQLLDARFMWDALSAEKTVHQWLEQHGFPRQKEFFEIDPTEIEGLFDVLEQADALPAPVRVPSSQWEDMYDAHDDELVRKELLEWAQEDLNSSLKYIQHTGQQDLERRSAQGDGEASVLLATSLASQGVNESNVRLCSILMSAAEKQGQAGASLQGLQWETLVHAQMLPLLWEKMWAHRAQMERGEELPSLIKGVFENEQQLWHYSPSRSSSWGEWCAARLPKRSL